MKKITVIATLASTILVGIGIVAISVLPAEADGPPHIHEILDALTNILAAVSGTSTEVSNIEAKLDDPNFGLQEIKNEVNNIETSVNINLDATVSLQGTADAIKAKTDNLPTDPADNSDVLAAIAAISVSGGGYVPFKVVPSGLPMTCDEAGGFGALHTLTIDGASDFMLTGVILRPVGLNEQNDQIAMSNLFIDGFTAAVSSPDLAGISLFPGFELMGSHDEFGARVPTTIVAVGAGPDDIQMFIVCDAFTTQNIEFQGNSIMVSGWKLPSDTITATFS